MKRLYKLMIIIVVVIFLLFTIDLVFVFTINRPLLAVKGSDNYTYKGLFFDTYNCPEYPMVQIKMKGAKLRCSDISFVESKVIEIVDTSKNIKDFTCAEALEQFYEDKDFIYYYSCIKSKYIIVRYENGYEETVKDALLNNKIKITDLDLYNISYLKYDK